MIQSIVSLNFCRNSVKKLKIKMPFDQKHDRKNLVSEMFRIAVKIIAEIWFCVFVLIVGEFVEKSE